MPGTTFATVFFIYCISVFLFLRKLIICVITRKGGNCDALQLRLSDVVLAV